MPPLIFPAFLHMEGEMVVANRDVRLGIILLIFGVIVGAVSFTKYKLMAEYGPGPGFLPFVLCTLLVIMALILIIQARKNTKTSEPEKEDLILYRPIRVLSCLGVLLLTAYFFETLGFVIVICFSAAFFAKMVKLDYPLYKCFLVGFITAVSIYFTFSYMLNINLPKGVLPL